MTARYPGTCEICLGAIQIGDEIEPCPGVVGAYQHTNADRCADAKAGAWRVRLGLDVEAGLLTEEQAARAFRVQTGGTW